MTHCDLHACLADRRRYERQIDRLHDRHLQTSLLYELQQDDVPLASLALNRTKVSRILARTVARGAYRPEPARLRTIQVKGKERVVFSHRLTDALVHATVADLIEEAMAPRLSPSLYSYRRGVSWWTAVSAFASFVREVHRRHADPRHRHLYVARRDVQAYTDSIPVGAGSPVWPMLRSLFRADSIRPADWDLVESVVRPVVVLPGGERAQLLRGVPTGQPVSCVLFNLYLDELDHALDAIPGGFYARYSDDILFAHPDPDVVRAAAVVMDEIVVAADLRLKTEKAADLYVTAAGRPSAVWPTSRGASSVQFLGARIWADGTVSLSADKARLLLRDVEDRAQRTARLLGRRDRDEVGRAVCSVVNRALDPESTQFEQQRSSALVRRAVTDRRQLQQLDYWIARIVLGAVTGQRNVRAFREVPYRRLREDWGLRSLTRARNEWGREA